MSTTPQYAPREYTVGQDVVSAADLNARGRELSRLGHIDVPGGEVASDGSGVHIVIPSNDFVIYAEITGHGTGANELAHSWEQLSPTTGGNFSLTTNGFFGDGGTLTNPAYELNGAKAPIGSMVRLTPRGVGYVSAGGQSVVEWVFDLTECP